DATYQLGKVFSDVSELSLPSSYEKDSVYAATIHSMEWDSKLKMASSPKMGKKELEAFERKYKAYFEDKKPMFLDWSDDSAAANFHLVCEANEYFMVEKGSEVPLFKRCKLDELPAFFEHADKAAKWFFVRNLDNPLSALKKGLIEIEVTKYEADNEYQAQPVRWDKPIDLNYGVVAKGQPRISVAVKSSYGQPLNASIVWLSSDFDIDNGYVQGGKGVLLQGIPFYMARWSDKNKEWNEKVFVAMPKPLQDFGVTEAKEYLKVIVSTKDIDTSSYNQKALPFDEAYYKNRKVVTRSAGTAKGGGGDEEETEPEVEAKDDWTAFTIPLRIVKSASSGKIDEVSYRAEILGHEIKVPKGFKAEINAGGVAQGRRSTGLTEPISLQNDEAIQPYVLSQGLATGTPLTTLELRNVENKDLVTAENPMEMSLSGVAEDEIVFSYGYDADAGLYYPVGFEDKTSGALRIETLPDPTADGQRSLGGSIVLFLKKVVLETVKIDYTDLYKLRSVTLPDDLAEKPVYEEDLIKIRQEVAGAKRILLCAHGIIGDTTEMVKFVRRISLAKPYDLILAFDYENLDTEIEDIAAQFKSKLAGIGLGEGHGKTLHVVAHSMGGLVSRWFYEQMNGDKVISHLVMVGTPNNGSQWGTAAQFVSVGLGFALNFLELAKPVQTLLKFLGRYGDKALTSLKQMQPGSDFMKKLNSKPFNTVRYSIIAGDVFSIRTTEEQAFFEKLAIRAMKLVAKPVFRDANDIACTVKSIQGVSGANSVAAIACDHMSYFVDVRGLRALEEVMAKL
ncbi:MAG: hypothetical protein IT258_13730, partial [Saprospiraceae bacterium]|nr:hypothetical protein [Saprospiraceae bacterium]